MLNQHQKLRLVAVAAVMQLFLGTMYAWSIFRTQISGLFPGFTAAQLSLNFALCMIGFALGGFFGGKLTARHSPRGTVRLAAILLCAGYWGASFMGRLEGGAALLVMYMCYGVLCGLGTGVGYNACLTGVSPWFPKRLGLVSGILLMGFGFGSLVLGLLAKALCNLINLWTVFRLYGTVILLVLLAGSFVLRKPPEAAPVRDGQYQEPGDTPGKMLKSPSFWVYFLWNVIMSASGQLIINSAANIALFFGAGAGLGLVVSIFNGGGRPLTGMIMDALGQFKGMLLMNSLLILAGILLVFTNQTGSLVTMCMGMFIVGICYGGGVTISAKVIRDVYGPKHYSVNFSLSNFCSIPASFLGPYLSGLLQDRSNGAFGSTFILLTGMGILAFCLIFLLRVCLKSENRA